jgi:transposase
MNDQNPTSGDRLKGKLRKFPEGSAKVKEKFIELRAQGMSYDQIAGQLDVSRQCLQNWSRELKADLENAKAFHLDGIKAKYQMLQAHRVEQFSMMLQRLRDEVAKRDLSEVATDKLLDLFIKFTKEARNEVIELQFTDESGPFDFAKAGMFDDLARRPML